MRDIVLGCDGVCELLYPQLFQVDFDLVLFLGGCDANPPVSVADGIEQLRNT
jgi:hypothetical protein